MPSGGDISSEMLFKLDRKVEWGREQVVRSELGAPSGHSSRLPRI